MLTGGVWRLDGGLTGDTSDGDEPAVRVVLAADGVRGAVWRGFVSMHARREGRRLCTDQLPAPIPMTESGEQVMPTTTSGPSTMPSSPRMSDATGLLAFSTELQHWTGPVEQVGGGFADGFGLFAATNKTLNDQRMVQSPVAPSKTHHPARWACKGASASGAGGPAQDAPRSSRGWPPGRSRR